MSFNCQQSVSHYLHDNSPFTPSYTRSSPPIIRPHHKEQHMQSSPGKFTLSSSSSSSLALYGSRSKPTSNSLADKEDDDDNQPLDLSIHTNRKEQTLKRSLVDEHNPICMIKSCTCQCRASSPQPEHWSPYSSVGQGMARSPNPATTTTLSSESNTDSPFSAQHQTRSAYNSCTSSVAAAFPCYIPQPSPWAATENSTYHHITTSDNDAHKSSSLFRPYGDDLNQEMSKCEQQQASQQMQHVDVCNDDNADEPTYMDLDSTTTMPIKANAKNNECNSNSVMCGNANILQPSSTYGRRTEDTFHSPHQSALVQALNKGINFASSDLKCTPCFVGGVISHTSLGVNKKMCSSPSNVSSSSEQQKYHPQQQMYISNSPPPLHIETALTDSPNYNSLGLKDTQSTLFQSKSTVGHLFNSYATECSIYSKVNQTESPSSTSACLEQSRNNSPLDKSNIFENKSHNVRSSPSSTKNFTKTSFSQSGITRSQHRQEAQDNRTQEAASEIKDNDKSTKISLLDFWISKILMERTSDAPIQTKPCNVDYICTANGEKKIRLRLVDLMELQVEQSLKA